MTFVPAEENQGICFVRVDHPGRPSIKAEIKKVIHTARGTILGEGNVKVFTVEHVMAALVGCGVHNALVEVNGPEVPILDGSASVFVRGILSRGLRNSQVPVTALRVRKPVEVRRGDAMARLVPHESLLIEFSIDFEDAAIGSQKKTLNMSNGSFVRELSTSRTFCRQADVEAMLANGLAQGGTPGENAVVFDGDRVICPGGLRHADEPVRHKMLDALGDLGLAGAPILGHYQGVRAGHALTSDLLAALFADSDAHEMVECDPLTAARLPGAGVHPGEIPEVA